MGGKSEQKTKPSPESQAAAGLLLGYVAPQIAQTALPTNPVFANYGQPSPGGGGGSYTSSPTFQPTSGMGYAPWLQIGPSSQSPTITGALPGTGSPTNPFGTPGSVPGTILPDWEDLMAMSGQSFFGSFGEDSPWATAMNQILNPKAIQVPQIGGGGMGGTGASLGRVIPNADVQQALDKLLNPASVFDQMSGGPIVDEINARTNALQDANSARAMRDMERMIDIANADLAAGGIISGDVILRERRRIIDDVMDDLNVINAGVGLESTRFLGELAMQDLLMQSNNAQAVLQQAMVEKGIDANYAAQMAKIAADKAIAQAQLQLQAQLGQQSNALNLLGLGLQDYQNMLNRQLGTATLPFNLLGQVMGLPSIGSGSSKGSL